MVSNRKAEDFFVVVKQESSPEKVEEFKGFWIEAVLKNMHKKERRQKDAKF